MSYKGDNLMSVKRTNRSAALHALHEKGAMSRKRLAESMNLTPAAITKIVGDMIGDGLLSEGEMLSSGGAGRRGDPDGHQHPKGLRAGRADQFAAARSCRPSGWTAA